MAKAGVTEADIEQVPEQQYFPIPPAVLFDTGLRRGERVTALRLASYMEGGAARIAQEVFAKARGLSPEQVGRHLRALEAAGHLEITRTAYDPALQKRDLPNRYTFMKAATVAWVSCPSEAVVGGATRVK